MQINRRKFINLGIGATAGTAFFNFSFADESEKLSKKWFPGHYLKIRNMNDPLDTKWCDLVRDNKYFRGYKIQVVWNELEPEKDKYDFSVIRAALKIAKDDKKKLMIHMMDRVFGRKVNPHLPEYMLTSEYEGGWFDDEHSSLGRAWLPVYQERWVKLISAMGKEFDKNPDLAGIMLSETSKMFTPGKKPASWNLPDILKFAEITFSTFAEQFPTTILFQYVNWGVRENRDGFMEMLVEKYRHGFGGPDIYDGKRPEVNKSWTLDMQFAEYYSKYKGIAPICVENQNAGYKASGGAQEVFDYAVDKLSVNFLPWVPIVEGGKYTIHDAIKVVSEQKGRISSTPPANIHKSFKNKT